MLSRWCYGVVEDGCSNVTLRTKYTKTYNVFDLPWCKTMRHTRVTMRSLLAMLIVQSFLYQLLLWFAVLSSLFFWFVLQSISQFACCQLFCQILHLWGSMSQPAFIYHHNHSVWSLVTLGQPCIMSLFVAWVSRLGSLPRSHHGLTLVVLADPVKLTLGKQSQTLSNYFHLNDFSMNYVKCVNIYFK